MLFRSVIACASHGPAEIVHDGESGWLVPPDHEHAFAAALIEAATQPGERQRRGKHALSEARQRFDWTAIAEIGPPLASCPSTRSRAVVAIVSSAVRSAAASATAPTVNAARPFRRRRLRTATPIASRQLTPPPGSLGPTGPASTRGRPAHGCG